MRTLPQQTEKQQAPLTFAAFLAYHLAKEQAGDHSPVYVQVRKRGVVLCGRVIEAAPGDSCDFFRVDLAIGPGWVVHHNVRLCSHDGRCSCAVRFECAAERGAAQAERAAALGAVPLGNTGTTTEARP